MPVDQALGWGSVPLDVLMHLGSTAPARVLSHVSQAAQRLPDAACVLFALAKRPCLDHNPAVAWEFIEYRIA